MTHENPALRLHIDQTYVSLRIGMAVVGLAFPLVLWAGGRFLASESLQSSMSAYYHTQMRDTFVGILLALGSFLYLYKGYSRREDIALDFAGIFAIGIALFPTEVNKQNLVRSDMFATTVLEPHTPYVHIFCALAFFAAIAYVCIFRSKDSLDRIKDAGVIKKYRWIYLALGLLMIVVPIFAASLALLDPSLLHRPNSTAIFFVEVAAISVFSVYWLVKTVELHHRPALAEVTARETADRWTSRSDDHHAIGT